MTNTIPNTFQHPNIFIDKLSYFLTPEEEKVLNKAVREILGWGQNIESRQARIAMSVFIDGKFDKDGNRLCYGCGLSKSVIRKALNTLCDFNILIKIGKPTNDGQLYELQGDDTKIDWQLLEDRKADKAEKNTKRTQKATAKSLKSRLGG